VGAAQNRQGVSARRNRAHTTACHNDASHRVASRSERHVGVGTAQGVVAVGQHGRAERCYPAGATVGDRCAVTTEPCWVVDELTDGTYHPGFAELDAVGRRSVAGANTGRLAVRRAHTMLPLPDGQNGALRRRASRPHPLLVIGRLVAAPVLREPVRASEAPICGWDRIVRSWEAAPAATRPPESERLYRRSGTPFWPMCSDQIADSGATVAVGQTPEWCRSVRCRRRGSA
jgi:hypothetical protein